MRARIHATVVAIASRHGRFGTSGRDRMSADPLTARRRQLRSEAAPRVRRGGPQARRRQPGQSRARRRRLRRVPIRELRRVARREFGVGAPPARAWLSALRAAGTGRGAAAGLGRTTAGQAGPGRPSPSLTGRPLASAAPRPVFQPAARGRRERHPTAGPSGSSRHRSTSDSIQGPVGSRSATRRSRKPRAWSWHSPSRSAARRAAR